MLYANIFHEAQESLRTETTLVRLIVEVKLVSGSTVVFKRVCTSLAQPVRQSRPLQKIENMFSLHQEKPLEI